MPWNQLGQNIDGAANNYNTGRSVALSSDGKIVAITDYNLNNTGKVRIFKYDLTSNTWNLFGSITGQNNSNAFTPSVALSSDGLTLVMGEPGYSNYKGRVRIFKYNGTAWNQLGLNINGIDNYDKNGLSVALSSDGLIVAIGVPGYSIYDNGEVRIFKYNGTAWNQLGSALIGGILYENGKSVALSSDGFIVATGASSALNGRGEVSIFKYNQTTSDWDKLVSILGENGSDLNGNSVALSSDGFTVAIGSFRYPDNTSSGQVRIFKYNQTTTSWDKTLSVIGEDFNENGTSVALSSDGLIVAMGAPGYLYDTGKLRIFKCNNNIWNESESIIGESYNYYNATSIALSSNGLIVAVGAPGYSNSKGRVRLFQYSSPLPTISSINPIDNTNETNVTITGTNFVSGSTSVTFGGISATNINVVSDTSITCRSPMNLNAGSVDVVVTTPDGSAILTNAYLISNICFPAGTLIATNQGFIPIEKININKHTIRNKKIIGITKTITKDKYLICFEKDALGNNIPSEKTLITENHKIFYKGKIMKAKEFINNYENVTKFEYNGEILYNVLMEQHDKMIVNNLICETLDPENIVAKLHCELQALNSEEQKKRINKLNKQTLKEIKNFNNKKIINVKMIN